MNLALLILDKDGKPITMEPPLGLPQEYTLREIVLHEAVYAALAGSLVVLVLIGLFLIARAKNPRLKLSSGFKYFATATVWLWYAVIGGAFLLHL